MQLPESHPWASGGTSCSGGRGGRQRPLPTQISLVFPKSLFENYPYCGRLRLPMAVSSTKMGLQRSSATLSAPFLSLPCPRKPRSTSQRDNFQTGSKFYGWKSGCNGFIQKPFKMKELSQKLREILDEK